MTGWILRMIKGAIIGVGAILPGISGGVLSVVLGIYRPLMAFLAHPVRTFKQNVSFFIPILVGFIIGVMLLSRVVDWLFRTSPTPAIWLFIGLVAGTLPALWKEAGLQGRGRGDLGALACGALLMGAWMYMLSSSGNAQVTPNFLWWVLCGALWGLGLVVPGMSPSSLFIFFGLYQPMTAAIGRLDFAVILPMALGLLLTIALLARAINVLLKQAYSYFMHAILGVVFASTVAILPVQETIAAPAGTIVVYVVCFAVGAAIALTMDWLSNRIKPKEDEGAA